MIEKYLRIATPNDVPQLVSYARKFHQISPYKLVRFDEGKVEKAFHSLTTGMLMDGVALIALKDGEPIGFLAGLVTQTLFSSDRIAMELAWWIEESDRKSRASVLIYNAYEDWARRVKCVAVQGAFLPGVSPELDSFYERRGYRQVETSYMKEL